jgi:hypothetical protein
MLKEPMGQLPFGLSLTPNEWNSRTAKVDGIALCIYNNLGCIRIENILILPKCLNQRGNLNCSIAKTFCNTQQLLRLNKGLVALNVYNHVKRNIHAILEYFHCLGTPVGPAAVVLGCHNRLSTKALNNIYNSLVIGSHEAMVKNT